MLYRIGAGIGTGIGLRISMKKIPTHCYGKINRKEHMPLAFMKKMNEVKCRVSRLARDKKMDKKLSYIGALQP